MGSVLPEAGAEVTNLVEITTCLVGRAQLQRHEDEMSRHFPTLFPNNIYPANTVVLVVGPYREEYLNEVKAVASLV